MVKVFVYGTLKNGFPFFEKGLADARFLGPYRTVEPYPMLIAQDFFGPVMLDKRGEGLHVQGELYEVAEASLPTLEQLEGVGKPGSFSRPISVEPLGGGIRVEAIGFFKGESWAEPAKSGYLSDYQDRRFIPPWERS